MNLAKMYVCNYYGHAWIEPPGDWKAVVDKGKYCDIMYCRTCLSIRKKEKHEQ